MRKSLVIFSVLVLMFSMTFVSAGFWDWFTGDVQRTDVQAVRGGEKGVSGGDLGGDVGYWTRSTPGGPTLDCKSDGDCGGGLVCCGGECVTVVPGAPPCDPEPPQGIFQPGVCTTDADCLVSGEVCNNGQCVPSRGYICKVRDNNLIGGQDALVCDNKCNVDSAGNICSWYHIVGDNLYVPGIFQLGACTSNADCGVGEDCINGACQGKLTITLSRGKMTTVMVNGVEHEISVRYQGEKTAGFEINGKRTTIQGPGEVASNGNVNVLITNIEGEETTFQVVPTTEFSCKDIGGCELPRGDCVSTGYTYRGDYCSNGKWIDQSGEDASCDQNFECRSNLCIPSEETGKCAGEGFWKRITRWFRGEAEKEAELIITDSIDINELEDHIQNFYSGGDGSDRSSANCVTTCGSVRCINYGSHPDGWCCICTHYTQTCTITCEPIVVRIGSSS